MISVSNFLTVLTVVSTKCDLLSSFSRASWICSVSSLIGLLTSTASSSSFSSASWSEADFSGSWINYYSSAGYFSLIYISAAFGIIWSGYSTFLTSTTLSFCCFNFKSCFSCFFLSYSSSSFNNLSFSFDSYSSLQAYRIFSYTGSTVSMNPFLGPASLSEIKSR